MVSAFLTLTLTTVCAGLIFQSTSVALPKVFAERMDGFVAGGAASVGLLVTVVYLGAALFQVWGGVLADRLPLKWVYVVAYVVMVPALALAASMVRLPLLGLVMLVVLLQNGAAPAETALFARYSPARWRATAFGIKFVVALGVSALGVPLVAVIHERTGGFYWLFVAMAVFATLGASFALLLPSEGRAATLAPTPVPVAGGSDD
jgi:MFS family permease